VTTRDFGVGFDWIIDPIVDVAIEANDQSFGFHIDGVAEGLNYLTYSRTNDQYKRHIDLHMGDLNSARANFAVPNGSSCSIQTTCRPMPKFGTTGARPCAIGFDHFLSFAGQASPGPAPLEFVRVLTLPQFAQ